MLSGAVFFGWYGYQMSKPEKPVLPAVVEPVKQAQVVAAKKIFSKQVISKSDLETVMVLPADHAGFKSANDIVGRVALHEIESGDVVLETHFEQYGPAARQLLPGERAVAIKIDEVAGVGGYIKPGDHVDVLFFANDEKSLNRSSLSQVVLSDLRVLSFGDAIQETKKADASISSPLITAQKEVIPPASSSKPDTGIRSAVLAVPEKDATTLMLAANMGQLRLALRGERMAPADLNAPVNQAGPAKSVSNQPENFFVRSEQLLKPDGLNREPVAVSKPISAGIAAIQPRSKVKSSQVIVHYGDSTETLVIRDVK